MSSKLPTECVNYRGHEYSNPPPVRDSTYFFTPLANPSLIETLKFQINELRLQLHGKEANIVALRNENEELLNDLIKERRRNNIRNRKEKRETSSQTETVARQVAYEASEDSASSMDSGTEFQNLMDLIPADQEEFFDFRSRRNPNYLFNTVQSNPEPALIFKACFNPEVTRFGVGDQKLVPHFSSSL